MAQTTVAPTPAVPPKTPPPGTPHDPYENYDMPTAGFEGTAEEIERQWYEKCYKGRGDSMLQLTWRAVLAAFDADPQVRAEAYSTLESWASDSQPTAAATAARAGLRQVDEARSAP